MNIATSWDVAYNITTPDTVDGFLGKEFYTINQMMPGPILRVQRGDWLNVTITNSLLSDGNSFLKVRLCSLLKT